MQPSKTTPARPSQPLVAHRDPDAAALHLHELLRRARAQCLDKRLTPSEADDLCQDLAMRLLLLRPEELSAIQCLEAYVHRMASNLINDRHRKRKRHQKLVDALTEQASLEPPAVDPRDPRDGEPSEEHRAKQLDSFVASYVAKARQTRRGNPAVQLEAWYWLRIRKRRAEEVAARLRAEHRSRGGRNTVWKWAQRGADLVKHLVELDDDTERAAVMRRAARLATA